MKKDLFYEIGTEEIPARFINSALSDIKRILNEQLIALRIDFSSIEAYATPRRFAILVKDIDELQSDFEELVKGPSKKISYDEKGEPTKALIGFVNSKGGKLENVEIKQDGSDEYVYLKVFQKGLPTKEYTKDLLEKVIRNINFAKPMKWGNKNIKFIRPIRWLICLLGEEKIDFDIEGIKTTNATKGHRFLGKSEIEVSSFEDYKKKLEENFVILDHNIRKEIIRKQAQEVAESLNGKVIIEEDILDEVNFIVEYPTAFYGNFSDEYLTLPKEVVITPMQNHQRYFPVVDSNDNLMNYFITVRNGDDYMIDNVRKGNQKVLDARLKDALFFYNEDTKKSLDYFVPRLETIVFHQKLGTMADKVERLKTLSVEIAKKLDYNTELLNRAVSLAKADLTTQMVFEFGELQGIMGRYYATLAGEANEVCEAIYEHYLPRNADDEIASTQEGIVISLADKLDTITGFFAIGIQPTGSQDPYALRRQAIGILSTMIERKLNVSVRNLVELSCNNYKFEISEEVKNSIEDFIMQRLSNMLSYNSVRYDIVNSIMDNKDMYVYRIVKLTNDLSKWLEVDRSKEFVTYNRANNLIKNHNMELVDESLFTHNSEKELSEKSKEVNSSFIKFANDEKYYDALLEMSKVTDSINNLFENVMIMDKDETVKNNRLSLIYNSLKEMKKLFNIEEIEYK